MAIFHCLGDSRLPADSAACRIEGPAQTGSAALLPGARSRAGATAPPCPAPAPGWGQIRAQGGTDGSWHTKRVLTSASSHRHLSLFLGELLRVLPGPRSPRARLALSSPSPAPPAPAHRPHPLQLAPQLPRELAPSGTSRPRNCGVALATPNAGTAPWQQERRARRKSFSETHSKSAPR